MANRKHSISIVVADDHPIVLSGIVNLLSRDPSFKLITSSTQPAGTLEAIRAHKPDVALIDMNMPGLSGLQILKSIVSENLPTRFILLAATLTDEEIVAAVEGGAHGLILKESAPDALMNCLNAVAAGKKWFPAGLVNAATERVRERQAEIGRISNLLSHREIEIMLRAAEGLSNKEVGRQLNISEGTVKIHLHSIYQKIGVGNRTSLANFAMTYRDRFRK